ncbi:MAG: DUF4838 domain-containing protein [Lentisphaeria bacterium]|nr:DUF4838 domain-containing protein [Lentisphaeria bacterium]
MRILIGFFVLLAATSLNAWSIGDTEKNNLSVSTAVEELKHYLKLCASDIKIDGKSAVFHIGDTAKARSAGINTAKLAEEEWLIKSDKNDIFITGGGKRGTLYGVFVFIEKYLSVRYFNAHEEYIPAPKELAFKSFDEKGRPFFKFRNLFRDPEFPDDKGRFAAKMRINQDGQSQISPQYGCDDAYGLPAHVHNIERADGYLPTAKYLKSNPEYYAIIKGKRDGSARSGQLCFSNPDLVPLFKAKLREYVKQSEARAAQRNAAPPRIYDISMNDNLNFCQCQRCAEAVKKYNRSGVLLNFLNQIADDLKTYRPGCYIQTLAYFATQEPPRNVKIADNIIIRLCDTYSKLTEPVTSPANTAFRTRLQAWAKQCKNIIIWKYAITYDDSKGMAYPSEFNYPADFAFYAKNNVIGVFMEHEGPSTGDMYDLKVYLEAKFMENPNADFHAVTKDFMHKYYGSAAENIILYRKKLFDAAKKNKAPMAYFSPSSKGFRYVDFAVMAECQKLFDNAENMVKNDTVLLHRVRRARMGLDLLLVKNLMPHYLFGMFSSNMDCSTLFKMINDAQKRVIETHAKSSKILKNTSKRFTADVKNNFDQMQYSAMPEIFKDKKVIFFPLSLWRIHSKKFITLAPSDKAFFKYACKVDMSQAPASYKNPMRNGICDEKLKKITSGTPIKPAADNDFKWYRLGTFRFNKGNPSHFFITNNWGMSISTSLFAEHLGDRDIDLYIEMKFNKENMEIGTLAAVIK